jgi:restriction endonuclease S subunit
MFNHLSYRVAQKTMPNYLYDEIRKGSGVNAEEYMKKYNEYLASNFGYKQFKSLQTGSALKQLPKGNLIKLNILIPALEEQTKIANFLSAIDDKIQAVETQIEKMEIWKKGLLQQMFC